MGRVTIRLLSSAFVRWALVVSNHRPPPCKGEANVLVSVLRRPNRVPRSSLQYLGVPPSRYAHVMQPEQPALNDESSAR
jgi:hypothetical protein